jgi:hypothetical protein
VKWSPSFECHVRPDDEHQYRIGQPLVDEFLETVRKIWAPQWVNIRRLGPLIA